MVVPCNFCNSKTALLYCRGDSAKLRLSCDHHVHSANALSLQHVRFQICFNCQNEIAMVRCITNNLLMCHECDWNAHSNSLASSLHERIPFEGFSGCPSIYELAQILGFVLRPKGLVDMDNRGCVCRLWHNFKDFQGCMICENYEDEVYEQLLEMSRRNIAVEDNNGAKQGEVESPDFNNGNEDDILEHQIPLTPLLMLPTDIDLTKNDSGSGEDLQRDYKPAYGAAQIKSGLSSSSHVIAKEERTKKGKVGLSRKVTMRAEVSLEEAAKNGGNAMFRYKEKNKNGRYKKQIYYGSRKAWADMIRKRARGRLVKASDATEYEV